MWRAVERVQRGRVLFHYHRVPPLPRFQHRLAQVAVLALRQPCHRVLRAHRCLKLYANDIHVRRGFDHERVLREQLVGEPRAANPEKTGQHSLAFSLLPLGQLLRLTGVIRLHHRPIEGVLRAPRPQTLAEGRIGVAARRGVCWYERTANAER